MMNQSFDRETNKEKHLTSELLLKLHQHLKQIRGHNQVIIQELNLEHR